MSARRDQTAARAFFEHALTHGPTPMEVVTTDRAPVYPRVVDDLVPAARHTTGRYENNAIETDHWRLKARLRPVHSVKTIRSLRVIAAGHAFVQNLVAALKPRLVSTHATTTRSSAPHGNAGRC